MDVDIISPISPTVASLSVSFFFLRDCMVPSPIFWLSLIILIFSPLCRVPSERRMPHRAVFFSLLNSAMTLPEPVMDPNSAFVYSSTFSLIHLVRS